MFIYVSRRYMSSSITSTIVLQPNLPSTSHYSTLHTLPPRLSFPFSPISLLSSLLHLNKGGELIEQGKDTLFCRGRECVFVSFARNLRTAHNFVLSTPCCRLSTESLYHLGFDKFCSLELRFGADGVYFYCTDLCQR
jgi:hypothetical protein